MTMICLQDTSGDWELITKIRQEGPTVVCLSGLPSTTRGKLCHFLFQGTDFVCIDRKVVKLSNKEIEKALVEQQVVEIGVVTAQDRQFEKQR
jgi:hypothetical protein